MGIGRSISNGRDRGKTICDLSTVCDLWVAWIRTFLRCWLRTQLVLGSTLVACPHSLAAESAEPPELRIQVVQSGRGAFEVLVTDIASLKALGVKPVVRFSTSIAALRDFCRGDTTSPDIVLVAYHLHGALQAECDKNGVSDRTLVELGRSALILATRKESAIRDLTSYQVYLAVAREVPYRGEFVRNVSVRWSDIDKSLPSQDIRFQLPVRDDGTRELFNALVVENGCRRDKVVKQIYDAQARTVKCVTTRTDRVREIRQEHAVAALLEAPVGTIGVLSNLELMHSDGRLVGIALDGVTPTYDAILSASYDNARSFWLYAKRRSNTLGDEAIVEKAVKRIIDRVQSEDVIGPEGILASAGLVPIPLQERETQRATEESRSLYSGLESPAYWVTSLATRMWELMTHAMSSRDDTSAAQVDFTMLMEIAGYKVKEIESSFGLIPGANMSFGIAREMSESDEEYLDRVLYLDSRRRPGIMPAAQRSIVRTILDAREVGGLEVSKVTVNFLPLPYVSLSLSPKEDR